MKKSFIIIISVLIVIAILLVVLYFLIISGGIFSFRTNPSEPEITYGEFPISVTFEFKGEIKVVTDKVICEFDGFENYGSAGKYRKWKSHLQSGKERITLVTISETAELYCWEGSPEYYMDDLRYDTREHYEQIRERNFDSYFITYGEWKDGIFESIGISLEEAWEKYNFKVIDVQYAEPIENNYR